MIYINFFKEKYTEIYKGILGVNQKSKKYLDDFEEYLKDEKNFSSHTLRAYSADVLTFLIWANEINIEDIDTKKFSEYLYFIGQLNN